MRKVFRRLAYATGATTALAASCVAFERMPGIVDPDSRLGNASSAIIAAVRFTRSLHTAAFIIADYRHLFAQYSDYHSDEYRAARSIVHERSAERMLALARAQGAVYVKIGQHIASMNHTAPPEYISTLKQLEDRAAYRPFWQVERSLSRQYAPRRMQDIFEEFERVPVAAASLAQVHRAQLCENGQRVAVKIQYPGLEALVRGDLTSIQVLSWLLKQVFPFFNADFVVEQFRMNLKKEVDFLLEAQSAQRAAVFFQGNDKIRVPRVHEEYSTQRVLVMDYIDGCRIDDIETINKAGISTRDVAQAVVDAFASMVFVFGHVHCDPHAGNLLVRPKGSRGNFEVFLLDHGLYRELNDDFRQAYCKLWKGLVLRRSDDVKDACDRLGASGLENIFSLMLLNRSWKSAKQIGTDIRMKMSPEELKELRKDFRASGLNSQADISSLVERVPEDLFLVFKMNALVRNVNKALGASVNRFKVNARYAVRGLRHRNQPPTENGSERKAGVITLASTGIENGQGWGAALGQFQIFQWFGQIADEWMVEVNLLVLDFVRTAVKWWYALSLRGSVINNNSDITQIKNIDDLLG